MLVSKCLPEFHLNIPLMNDCFKLLSKTLNTRIRYRNLLKSFEIAGRAVRLLSWTNIYISSVALNVSSWNCLRSLVFFSIKVTSVLLMWFSSTFETVAYLGTGLRRLFPISITYPSIFNDGSAKLHVTLFEWLRKSLSCSLM